MDGLMCNEIPQYCQHCRERFTQWEVVDAEGVVYLCNRCKTVVEMAAVEDAIRQVNARADMRDEARDVDRLEDW